MGAKTTRSKCATGACRLYQRGRVRHAKERARHAPSCAVSWEVSLRRSARFCPSRSVIPRESPWERARKVHVQDHRACVHGLGRRGASAGIGSQVGWGMAREMKVMARASGMEWWMASPTRQPSLSAVCTDRVGSTQPSMSMRRVRPAQRARAGAWVMPSTLAAACSAGTSTPSSTPSRRRWETSVVTS
jgi:hypothetical protein